MGEGVVEKVGHWAAELDWASVPEYVKKSMVDGMLQSIAGGLAGFEMPETQVTLRLARPALESGPSTILGAGTKAPIGTAAYINAVMFSALEQQEVHYQTGSHPFEVIVPPALALSEALSVPGPQLLEAVLAGVEVNINFGMVGEEALPLTSQDAACATAIYGALGTAVMATKLLGGDAGTIATALCHAGNLGAGLNQCLWAGTTEYHQALGNASRVGLLAADLAMAGAEATYSTFEGASGFYHRFAQLSEEEIKALGLSTRIGEGLGRPWRVTEHLYKRYPVHYNNMPFIDAAKLLASTHSITGGDVQAIRLKINRWCELCDGGNLGPYHGREATRGATAFGVAAMLSRGRFGLDDVGDLDAPDIMALVGKTRISTFESPIEAADWRSVRVEIDARGRTFVFDSKVDLVPDYRLGTEELKTIAQDALSRVLGADKTRRALLALEELPSSEDVAKSLVPFLVKGS
jgi:2-methylcitrate dehydratase PrpD